MWYSSRFQKSSEWYFSFWDFLLTSLVKPRWVKDVNREAELNRASHVRCSDSGRMVIVFW
jgi:hypothetical protein